MHTAIGWRSAYAMVVALVTAGLLAGCPPFDPEVDLSQAIPPEDKYDVQIIRDSYGVPHIYGKTNADVAYGLAWAHSEDDFATIQEGLFLSHGSYALLNRFEAIPFDYLVRAFRFKEIVEEQYETQLSDTVRAMCEAYADGINHYAALHPAKVKPGVWPATGQDIVTGFVAKTPLFFGMDDQIRQLLDPAEAEEEPEGPAINQVSRAQDPWTYMRGDHPIGSNVMAVAPSRTPDGSTHLAVNSHQPWTGPVAWYEARLKSEEGYDVTGGVFPGTPVVLHGHSPHHGWAHTVNKPDLTDVYELELNPDNEDQYRFDGAWRDFEKDIIELPVRLAGNVYWTFQREALFSVHGPAFRVGDKAYAVRYATYGNIGQVEQWFRIGNAQNMEDFRAVMAMQAIPSFNTVYADKAGNIAYIYNGVFPDRAPGYDWQAYLPGNTSETLWEDYLPFEAVPQMWNPSAGWVQNCNSTPYRTGDPADNPNPEDFAPEMGIEDEVMTNRALRAIELFGSDDSITWDEFYAYKYDGEYSQESAAAKLREEILAADLPDDPVVNEALERLRAWDLKTDRDNTSTAVAILPMEPVVRAQIFGRPVPDLLELFVERARDLDEVHGTVAVPWGEVNRLVRGDVNLSLDGGPDVLHAIYGDWNEETGQLNGVAGDCYVALASWDAEGNLAQSLSIHQFGSATLDEDSPHYADQAPLFAAKEMKPTWLDEADLRANMRIEYAPGDFTGPWYEQVAGK